jgi:monoterpene epsilon-lactone hydrolase
MLNLSEERKYIEAYLNGADPRAPLASPIYGDLRELPPLLMQVGSHELLLSDVERFAEKARAAGVDVTLEVWPEMQHDWQVAAKLLPEGRQAIAHVGDFVERVLSV